MYIDQAKREGEIPRIPSYVAALLDVLSAQLDFINVKYSDTIKCKIKMELNTINFFLHNPERLRIEIKLT